jgi:hypothetical protein
MILRFLIVASAVTAWAYPQAFTFAIGNPVASEDFHSKSAVFVFRTEGCAEPAKARIDGTAEGLVNGARRSMPLKVMPASKPGVYAVFQNWPPEGAWVINLKGTCNDANAGALVPIGPKGFIRESAKFLTRPATSAEIETSLNTLASGGAK